MPDAVPVPDEVAVLRAANARLREVIKAKDAEVAMLREQAGALSAQVAELHARMAQNSRNSLADASLAAGGTLHHVDQAKLAAARHEYHSALVIGERETAARASPLTRKHHALARRLLQREDDYLRYTHDPHVPFDNNAAEREIRIGKLRIKVSGCMRSSFLLTPTSEVCCGVPRCGPYWTSRPRLAGR